MQLEGVNMKMKRTRVFTLMFMLAAILTVATACGKDPVAETAQDSDSVNGNSSSKQEESQGTDKETDSESGDQEENSDTFTYAVAGDPGETVNVITTSDRWGLNAIKLIYSPLFMNNADGINWFLATDYETEDNLTYTFHLRDDIVWSDGEPFNADDVVFTYTEMEKEENAGWAYSQLVYDQGTVEVKKVDDFTVSFTFPFLSPTSLEMLSQIFIMPEHIYKNVEDYEHNDINMHSIGTGPYQVIDYQPGSYVEFEANKNYFKGKPGINRIVYRVLEDSNTAMLALQNGEVDAYQASPAAVEKLDLEASHLKAYSYGEGRIGYMMVNANRLSDKKIRQAIFFALNKDEMNQAAFYSEDYYSTPYTFLPTSSQFYTDDVEKYTQDKDKVKALLDEAGVSELNLTLGYNGSDDAQKTQAVLIQEQLGSVGINVTLDSSDGTALFTQMADPENTYDLYLGGYIMGIDPDTFGSLFESGASYNFMHYDIPSIDQLFEAGRTELDQDKRKTIYADLQAVLQDEAVFYPIVSNNKILVVSDSVKGVDEAQLVPVYTFEDTSYLYIEK